MARKRVKKSSCPNCDFVFAETNNYCPNCGQENHTHKLPIKHFFLEILEGTLHLDTKIFVTLRDLFIPGRITLNYNQNKRGRYVPPIRLYIFISFIFFLLLSFSFNKSDEGSTKDEEGDDVVFNFGQVDSADIAEEDTSNNYLLKRIRESHEPDKLIDEYINLNFHDVAWYNRNIYRNTVKLETGHFNKEELLHRLYKSISYSMFFLMPIFAFFLYLLYYRKKMYYSEHLILAIHFHSLAFLLLSVWLLLSFFGLSVGIYTVLIILIFFLLLMRKVYDQGWGKTILKFLFLGFIYTVSIFVVLVIGVVLSVLV
ncbi:MAG TPA: DUF3667 domain-containing protein [Bacteroidales bacterium]|nr:DUF3667 domain-containing protein [Bacteroidales bacterium]